MRIQVIDNGTVWGFRPLDDEAKEKLHDIGAEPWQFMGNTLYVDHRPAGQLMLQLEDDGAEITR